MSGKFIFEHQGRTFVYLGWSHQTLTGQFQDCASEEIRSFKYDETVAILRQADVDPGPPIRSLGDLMNAMKRAD